MTRAEELKKSLMDMMEKWTGSLENEWSCHLLHEKRQFEDTLGYYTSAVREEEKDRLQKYTEKYLKEGIKRCSAALAQGRTEGATEERARLEEAYRKGEY